MPTFIKTYKSKKGKKTLVRARMTNYKRGGLNKTEKKKLKVLWQRQLKRAHNEIL